MAEIVIDRLRSLPENTDADRQITTPRKLWQPFALVGVMLVSLFMNFYQLGQNGFGNLYYAAGIRSMMDNWHNFFFVSFDPGGFVTIDKPPLAFWLQTLSAKIFGFTAFSVYLPQALSGVISVALLYHLVRKRFGVVAGLLAALALATSPISVVTNRNNTIDSTLTLVMLIGAWAVLRAAETGKLRWLLLCAVTIGIGFNIKMMEAYLVIPAFGLLYLLAAPKSIWRKLGNLALATILLLGISLSWALAVDLTPASQRPYVGSTQNNSEISLAIGYNGVQRLLGQFGFGGRQSNTNNNATGQPPTTSGSSSSGSSSSTSQRPQFPQGGQPGQGGPGGGAGGMFNTGTAGPLRLFSQPLAGQIAWLLPLALLGMVALIWQRHLHFKLRFQEDREQQSLVLWGIWLLTMGVFFSVAGFFHPYYLTVMAPAVAALFGIGIVTMWRDYRKPGWRGWLLPAALIATAAEQIYIVSNYPTWGQWLIPTIAGLCALGIVALVAFRLIKPASYSVMRKRVLLSLFGLAVAGLLVAPTVWAAIPVIQNVQAQLPEAGPIQQGGFGNRSGGNDSANTKLIQYLEAHQGSTQYLVATASSNSADSIILVTNKPVMVLGGFSGSDPILTVSQLQTLIKENKVHYFLISSGGFGPGDGQSTLTTWVQQHGTFVPTSQWQSSSTTSSTGFPGGDNQQLYYVASAS
jgi:4-amino-4-deoxy-L-arabinose transferase-like glycosyltransferase